MELLSNRIKELEDGLLRSQAELLNYRKRKDEETSRILKYAEEHVDAAGLGTTCVCSIFTKDFLLFGNIGDSSGFVIKNGKLYKVTKDHTLVNILLENGELTESAAKVHPQKNVLMKALGANNPIDIDIYDCDMDISSVLLCSDGLTSMLDEEQLKIFMLATNLKEELDEERGLSHEKK